jgi:pyruvate kinase
MKFTKIVCTIGPASSSEEKLRAMVKAGMNVARLNFSHGTHDEHAEFIRTVRRVAEELDEPVAILQDLQGPKIRVGELPPEGVTLVSGTEVIFTAGETDWANKRLTVTYDKLHEDVKPGERILIDDGLLSAEVIRVEGTDVICRVKDGGQLFSHKGVNFPESKLTVSAITEKDKDDLRFGVLQHVDWVALSFVRSAKEIYDLRYMIKAIEQELGPEHAHEFPARIVAKIEKHEAVDSIDEIIEAVDGIMVARGD